MRARAALEPAAIVLLLVLPLSACERSSTIAVDPGAMRPLPAARSPAADAAADAASIDGGAPSAVTSPFSEVARSVAWDLERLEGGPVLGVDRQARVVFELPQEGAPRVIAPLQLAIGERVASMMPIGRLAGRWPDVVHVEAATFAGRGGVFAQRLAFDISRGTVSSSSANDFTSAAWSWKGGALLAWVAESASIMGPYPFGRPGAFRVLAGPKPAKLPSLPARAKPSDQGTFVAYPSGRIFMVGGIAAAPGPHGEDEAEPDRAAIWHVDPSGKASPLRMPSEPRGLAHGREDTETFAWGDGWLSRWDGAAFAPVPTAPTYDVRAVSVGDDGSVWVAAGGGLFRADLPALSFAEVPLPAGYEVRAMVARNARDVWVSSFRGVREQPNGSGGAILHTRPPGAPFDAGPYEDETFYPALFATTSPRAFARGCQIAFLSFGTPADVSDEAARETAKLASSDLFAPRLLRGRTKDGPVVGLQAMRTMGLSDDADSANARKALALAKKRHPRARLLCTMPAVDAELEIPAP